MKRFIAGLIAITLVCCFGLWTTMSDGAVIKHPTYALGHAKKCKVGYVKKTEKHIVKVKGKKVSRRYVACVYVPPKAVVIPTIVPANVPPTVAPTTTTTPSAPTTTTTQPAAPTTPTTLPVVTTTTTTTTLAPVTVHVTVTFICHWSGPPPTCTNYNTTTGITGAHTDIDAGGDRSPAVGSVSFYAADETFICTGQVRSGVASNNGECNSDPTSAAFIGPITATFSGGQVFDPSTNTTTIYDPQTTTGHSN